MIWISDEQMSTVHKVCSPNYYPKFWKFEGIFFSFFFFFVKMENIISMKEFVIFWGNFAQRYLILSLKLYFPISIFFFFAKYHRNSIWANSGIWRAELTCSGNFYDVKWKLDNYHIAVWFCHQQPKGCFICIYCFVCFPISATTLNVIDCYM